MVRFPEKRELSVLTDRAKKLETPLHYFRQDFTPNEAFLVRWHVAGIPTHVVPLSLYQAQPLTLGGSGRDGLQADDGQPTNAQLNSAARCSTWSIIKAFFQPGIQRASNLRDVLESIGSPLVSIRHPRPCRVGPRQGAGHAAFGIGLFPPGTRVAGLQALRSNSPNRRAIVYSLSLQ